MNEGIDIKEKEEEGSNAKDETYYPYLKPELNLHIICDTTVYTNTQGFIPMLTHLLQYD